MYAVFRRLSAQYPKFDPTTCETHNYGVMQHRCISIYQPGLGIDMCLSNVVVIPQHIPYVTLKHNGSGHVSNSLVRKGAVCDVVVMFLCEIVFYLA